MSAAGLPRLRWFRIARARLRAAVLGEVNAQDVEQRASQSDLAAVPLPWGNGPRLGGVARPSSTSGDIIFVNDTKPRDALDTRTPTRRRTRSPGCKQRMPLLRRRPLAQSLRHPWVHGLAQRLGHGPEDARKHLAGAALKLALAHTGQASAGSSPPIWGRRDVQDLRNRWDPSELEVALPN